MDPEIVVAHAVAPGPRRTGLARAHITPLLDRARLQGKGLPARIDHQQAHALGVKLQVPGLWRHAAVGRIERTNACTVAMGQLAGLQHQRREVRQPRDQPREIAIALIDQRKQPEVEMAQAALGVVLHELGQFLSVSGGHQHVALKAQIGLGQHIDRLVQQRVRAGRAVQGVVDFGVQALEQQVDFGHPGGPGLGDKLRVTKQHPVCLHLDALIAQLASRLQCRQKIFAQRWFAAREPQVLRPHAPALLQPVRHLGPLHLVLAVGATRIAA